MTLSIVINTVQHQHQRYGTSGDWQFISDPDDPQQTLRITVSGLGDWRYEACVAIHEAVEALLCRHAGVTDAQVTSFDIAHAETRAKIERDTGTTLPPAEPGDDPACPYRTQHGIASGIERLLATGLGVYWDSYADKVDSL